MFFKKIKNYLLYKCLYKNIKPEIIGGYKRNDGKILKKTRISNTTHISSKDNNLMIEDNVFIGHFNYIDAYNGKVEIKQNVQITNYVSILTHSTHQSIRLVDDEMLSHELYNELKKTGDIYIGEFTYIGPHSVIMPGTKIGKGSIISAFSYVKGEFPDYSIIRGLPARKVGDTRELDKKYLLAYRDFQEFYEKWSNK